MTRPNRNPLVDAAFDTASSALVKAVFAAPEGDQVAIVSLALDMKTMVWMINSNVKAESFVAFLEGALAQVRRNLGEIQAISDKLTNETERD